MRHIKQGRAQGIALCGKPLRIAAHQRDAQACAGQRKRRGGAYAAAASGYHRVSLLRRVKWRGGLG
jgi:hypothetical protein